MTRKTIIFDFDGTVADTLDAIVRITNRLAIEYGYKPATPDELNRLRNMSSREVVQRSGVSVFKLPLLLRKIRADLQSEIQDISPIPGIKEVLVALTKDGNKLGILTSNSEENARIFLTSHGMQELFSFIYSETNLFGKQTSLRKILRTNKLYPQDVIYVGDETRDIEAAKKIPLKVIAVSWGYNSKEVLAQHNPDFLIDQPSQLLEVLGSLQKIVS